MKTFFILSLLTLLTSCNDARRNRLSDCRNEFGKLIACVDAYTVDETAYRKQYIAQVYVPVSIGQSTIVFNDSETDADFDQDYNCNVDVARGTKFNFTIEKSKLILKNSINSLTLVKTDRLSTSDILGTWRIEGAETNKVDTITEMVFMDLNEVRIKKVCNLKK